MSILVQFFQALNFNCLTLSFLILQSLCINFTIDVYHLVFDTFFIQVNKKHNYNTRSVSSLFYTLPKVRTNYGIFNLRFKGPKVWNSISDKLKTLSISNFKVSLKYDLVKDY